MEGYGCPCCHKEDIDSQVRDVNLDMWDKLVFLYVDEYGEGLFAWIVR